MKKLLLSIAVLLVTTTVVSAQSDVKALMVKLEKSNVEITHAKKMTKASTWVKRGDIYKAIGEVNYDKVFIEQPLLVLVGALGQPTNSANIPVENVAGRMVKIYEYPTVKVYVDENDNVAFFEGVAPAVENAFSKALECYNKALEVEPSQTKLVSKAYQDLIEATLVDGTNKFALRKYAEAYKQYEMVAQLRENKLINQDASDVYYELARAAILLPDFQKANINLDILIKKNALMDGMVLYLAGVAKSEIPGMEKEAEATFIRGIKEYPDNSDMLQGLVNHYVKTGEDSNKVIPYIKQAQEKDPTNINIVIQEGNAYLAMEDYVTAITAYERAIVMNPTYFNALYNKGFAYFRLSNKCSKELNAIDYTNVTATKEKTDEVLKYRRLSVEALEKALEVDPKSTNSSEILQALCFALRDIDPIYKEKYDKYKEINEAL